MRLFIVDHLQPMLSVAEEPIGIGELLRSAGIHPTSLARANSMSKSGAAAQSQVAAAGDQLLSLNEELDLADAAAAELEIVPGDGDRGMAR